MSANNRPAARSPGRTPPFILVGLVVLVGFLGYSYWSLSSSNSALKRDLESVEVAKREVDQKRTDVEASLEKAREALQQAQSNLDQSQKQVQDKEAEINNLKADLGNRQGEIDKSQKLLTTCDDNLAVQSKELETVRAEKVDLEKRLQEETQKEHTCDMAKCIGPVKQVLSVVSKLTGSDAVAKSLTDAQMDAGALMEGIQVPAPAADPQQNQPPAAAAPVQPKEPTVSPRRNEEPAEIKNNENIKEMNIGDKPGEQMNQNLETPLSNGTLVFQPKTDKNNDSERKTGEDQELEQNKDEAEEDRENDGTGKEENDITEEKENDIIVQNRNIMTEGEKDLEIVKEDEDDDVTEMGTTLVNIVNSPYNEKEVDEKEVAEIKEYGNDQ